jgi:Fe-S cluster assembly ATPase SufC
MQELTIKNLHVVIAEQEIIRGLSLGVPRGEVHADHGAERLGKKHPR